VLMCCLLFLIFFNFPLFLLSLLFIVVCFRFLVEWRCLRFHQSKAVDRNSEGHGVQRHSKTELITFDLFYLMFAAFSFFVRLLKVLI